MYLFFMFEVLYLFFCGEFLPYIMISYDSFGFSNYLNFCLTSEVIGNKIQIGGLSVEE